MKTILFVLFVCFLQTVNAADYYFSALSGDDSRTSTQARSSSTPWKSLSKLNSFFSSLLPGDAVLLKRGETFFGSITVKKSGTASSPIVIGAYGSGDKPVITSLVTLGDWVSAGNGIWESYNSSLGAAVNTVLVNNAVQPMGRYPNSDVANKGYLTLESHTSNSITDNQLDSTRNWTGAQLVLRARRWVIDRCLITNHSGRTITYTKASTYTAIDNYGYFIQNDIKTLDKLGEWYYNPSVKKLSVYFGANDPSSYVVQSTTIENLISANNYSFVVFDNLSIKGANSDGINISSGSNMNVKNCDIMFSGGNGVNVRYHANLKIENCTISYSGNSAIDLGFTGDYATIRNNKITNTLVFAGMGKSGDGNGFGIHSNCSSTLIEYNEIINTGYSAINFNGNSTIVKNNYVDGYCMTKDDGSGIYTHTGSSNINKYGRKVIGNIVLNGIGAAEGVDNHKTLVEGIYMDDNSSGVEINGNTVANIPDDGIYLHNTRNITVTNNTVFNNKLQLNITHDTKGDAVRNCIITNNNFFSKYITQKIAYFTTPQNDNNLIGRFDSNYYARPIDDRIVIQNSYVNSSGVRVNENLDLEGWKKKYNQDSASKRTAKQIEPYKVNSITSSNKIINGTFTSNINGVSKGSCTTLWSNSGLLDGGYLEVSPSANSSYINMKIGGITAGKKYILKYSVRGAVDTNMYIGTFLRKDGSPYTNLTLTQTRKVGTARSDNEMLFLPSATETAATVMFQVDKQSKYYLDNIQVYEADATITNIDDSIRFEYNATQVNKTVSLAGNYVDAKNNKYVNSILLKPYESAVLIKENGIVANTAPSVSITSPAINTTFAAPATVTIGAMASDADGTISKVEFYNKDTLLGTVTSSPYTFTWNNVAAGSYSITAKATDNGLMSTVSAAVAISVYTPNSAPFISIASPAGNASFAAPASVTISATASDADGTISKVDFYNADTLLGTVTSSPYTFTWNNVAAGSYSITAKATDNGSLVTASAAVAISVYIPNGDPSVSITSPAVNASFAAPASITISATATDTDGTISKVDFYNADTLLGTVTSSPYTFTWNNVTAGSYYITAKATDNSSSVTVSDAIAISVYPSNIPPSINLTSPVATTKYIGPASITISASASDADGTISKVEFYNGTTLLRTTVSSPYTYSWTSVAAGTYTITAKATDNGGVVTTAAAVTITVLQNKAPAVIITSPATNTKYNSPATINMSASASDADGTISKVQFYNGTILLRTEVSSPYTYSWVNVAAGTYTITAKATDNKGVVTTSAGVIISVVAPNITTGTSENNDSSGVINNIYALNLRPQTGSKEALGIYAMQVFPNPAINKIRINIKGLIFGNRKATLNIRNSAGILFKSIPVVLSGRTIEADVSSLRTGIYIVSIVSDNFIISRKLIKN